MSKKPNLSQQKKEVTKMKKSHYNNERIKRKYYDFLKESQGYSKTTITAIKKAIYRYEEFTVFDDFCNFNQARAIEFKKWIETKQHPKTGELLSLTTIYHYIRHLKDFFKWLAYQPGYKSKINLTDTEYLKLSKEKARKATSKTKEHYPTFEQIQKVIKSIEIKNELDIRDRALVAFTLLSGMRVSAIISLPIGSFCEDTFQIDQDPNKGVRTKFSKTIRSYLFRFDNEMVEYVLEWVRYLKSEKLFGNADPIFPANKIELIGDAKVFSSITVEPRFWQSSTSIREIFKERFRKAEVEFFSPHCFRHLAVRLATAKCSNGQELKAISQNFGHENLGTTIQSYGSINNVDVGRVISNMNFENNAKSNQSDQLLSKLKELLKNENTEGGF